MSRQALRPDGDHCAVSETTPTNLAPRHAPELARRAALAPSVRTILETSPFPVFLVSLVGVVLLTVFGPSLVVGDTWLTLMAGREIVDHGLPDVEHITLLGEGSTWTDQQWLAQLVFYGAHELAGVRLVVVLDVALVLLALVLAAGAARSAGASSRSTFLIGLLAILAGPWGWTIRAQSASAPPSSPAFLAPARRLSERRAAAHAARAANARPSGRTSSRSVVLGAGLTMLLALATLVQRRGAEPLYPLALLVCAPLCVLVTPYGWDIVAYYDLMLDRRAVRRHPPRVAVVEPERDDRAVLDPGGRWPSRSSRYAAAARG